MRRRAALTAPNLKVTRAVASAAHTCGEIGNSSFSRVRPRDVSHVEDIPPAELPQARSTLRPYAASFPHAQTRWSPRREIGDLFSAPGFPLRAHRAKTTQRPRREGPQRPPLIVGAHHTDLAGAAPRDQTVTPVAALEMK